MQRRSAFATLTAVALTGMVALTAPGVARAESETISVCREPGPRAPHADALRYGLCLERHGMLTEALAAYQDLMKRLPPKSIAGAVLGRQSIIQPQLATLTVVVEPAGAAVLIDGRAAGPERTTYVNPGTHLVRVETPGYLPKEESVAFLPGGTRTVELRMVAVPSTATTTATAAPPLAPPKPAGAEETVRAGPHPAFVPVPPPPQKPASVATTVGYLGLGVGIGGVALGAVTGSIAWAKTQDLEKQCPTPAACNAGREAGSAETFATVSTVSFITGATLLVLGGALLWLK